MMPSPSADQLPYLGPLLDHSEDAIVACDADWRVTVWNEGARRMFGWTAEEAVGQSAMFFGSEETDAQRMDRRRKLAEDGRWRGEVTMERKDGSEVPIESIAVAIRDEQRRTNGYLGIHRDITERKRAEEALREAKRSSETILESVSDFFSAFDHEWRYTYLNRRGLERFRQATGQDVALEDVIGKNFWELFPEFVGTTVDQELHRAVRGKETVIYETYSPGTESWVQVHACPTADGGLSVYGHDITDRKRAEEALREAQQRSQRILERITDAFVALDREWRFTYVNELALRRLRARTGRELTREEVLGASLWELLPDAVGTDAYDKYHEAVRTGRTLEFETYLAPADDWLEIHLYPSDSGLSIYFRDITERKRAEEQLESRFRQQAAVAELGVRALEEGRLGPLIDEAVTLVCRTLGVEYAQVDELLSGGQQLLVSAGAGLRDGVVGTATLPTGRGSPAGYALMIGEPVIVEDMAAETRFEVPMILREHEVMSDITVVIDPRGDPFGTLVAMSKKRRTFSEHDVSFMQSLANVLATAVEHAKAEERLEAARDAERSRIGRALHDEALQGLADAIALAAMADRTMAESRLAGQLLPVLRRVGEQLRSVIYDLHSRSEEHRPFVELLEQLVDAHRAMVGDCEIQSEIGEGIATGWLGIEGIEVLRVLGEALTNARRHADARHVRVRVWGTEDGLRAEVSDDGRGFDTSTPVAPTHRGITGMRERAGLLDGRLEIHSEPGVGTRVRLEAPLADATS